MPGFLENLTKPTEAKYSALKEDDYYLSFFSSYYDIVMSMFKWNDLPDSVDSRFMEKVLFESGVLAFWLSPETGEIYSLIASGVGLYDMYGNNTKYLLRSYGGSIIDETVEADDVVICYNNKIRVPTSAILSTTCSRLANISATIDTNVNAVKTPIILESDDYTTNSIKKLYSDFVRNLPVLFIRKSKNNLLDGNNLKVHSTGVEFYADRLLMLQHDIENDLLTRIGINNTNIQKKERLISNEVDSNLMEIMSHAYSMLDERTKFCEEVNKKFGLDISVEFRAKKEIDDLIDSNINVRYEDNIEEGEQDE